MKLFLLLLALLTPFSAECKADGKANGLPQSLACINAGLSGAEFKLMLARTEAEKAKGLMFYETLKPNQGMLFIYSAPQIMRFWMRNTKIALDIIFVSENLKVVDMISNMQPGYNKPVHELPVYTSAVKAKYAIELNAGSIKAFNIKLNDTLYVPITALYSSD